MTKNQLLALKPGSKVKIIQHGRYHGKVMDFVGLAEIVPVMAIVMGQNNTWELWFSAREIEHYRGSE